MFKKILFINFILINLFFNILDVQASACLDSNKNLIPDGLSCLAGNQFEQNVLSTDNVAVNDFFLQGSFSMCDSEAEGATVTLPDGSTAINCNVLTPTVKFKFKPALSLYQNDGIGEVGDGQVLNLNGQRFRGIRENDKICVQVWIMFGYVTMGCKYSAEGPLNNPIQTCNTSKACTDTASAESKGNIAISSKVIQCVKETLDNIFTCQDGCGRQKGSNPFTKVQNGMRTIVKLALTMYVIFFGIKIALGQEIPKKGEVFIFLIKAILVMYFSVGIYNPGNVENRQTQCLNAVNYEDGINKYLKPGFMGLGDTLSQIILNGANKNGLCYFDSGLYNENYSYLALWDSLDCRIAYYLGIYNPLNSAMAIFAPFLLSLPFALLFGGQIIIAILTLVFGVFVLSFTVFFVNIYIVSLVVVTILLYFAPLFVPMALFKQTKGYFDSWLKLTFGYALQPVVIMAFIALLFTVFDTLFYEGCEFENLNMATPYYVIKSPTNATCEASFGYKVASLMSQDKSAVFKTKEFLFFSIQIMKDGSMGDYLSKLLTLILLLFLFYHFSKILSQFAADLTSTGSLGGMAVSPNAVTDKVGGALKSVAGKLIDRALGGGAAPPVDPADGSSGSIKTRSGGPSAGTSASASASGSSDTSASASASDSSGSSSGTSVKVIPTKPLPAIPSASSGGDSGGGSSGAAASSAPPPSGSSSRPALQRTQASRDLKSTTKKDD